MRKPFNLYLIGPMGAGKSTIGRQLAKELHLDFHDSDQVVEERSGADVGWIFDVEGEDGFRKREKAVITDLTEITGTVLATGGGVVIEQENRNRLASRGLVIYLCASVEQQLKRTAKDKRRPIIQNSKNVNNDLIKLHEERDPLYREIADLVISTDGKTVRTVASLIVEYLEKDKFK